MSIKKVLHEVPDVPSALSTTKWYVEELITKKPTRNIIANGAVEGVDANTAIQDTIDELNSLGGGTLLIPLGTWRFTSLTWYSNILVQGLGPGSILDYRGSSYSLDLSGTNNIVFQNLKLVGSNASALSGGIFISDAYSLYFDNIIIKGFSGSDAFIITGGASNEVYNIGFNKLTIEKQTAHTYSCNKAFNIDGTTVYVKNINLSNCGITFCESDAIYIHGSQGICVNSCNINTNKGYALNLASNLAADGTYIYGVSVLGGTFKYNKDSLLGGPGDHSTNTPFNSNSNRTLGFVALGYRNFDPLSATGNFDGVGCFFAGDDGIIFNLTSLSGFALDPQISATLVDFTISSADYPLTILGNCTGGDISGSLPDASASEGRIITYKKIDSSVNDMHMYNFDLATIDGDIYKVLSGGQYDKLTVQCDGSDWHII